MKTRLLLYFSILLLTGCSLFDPCRGYDPAPLPPVSFYFTDGNGVNLVSDSGGGFHPDSVEIKTDSPPYTTYIQRKHSPQKGGAIFEVYPSKEQSGTTTFYIKLSQDFSDTLVVSYLIDDSGCFPTIEYTEIFHNRKEIFMEGGTGYLQLIK